jgi:hypothetical protein
MFATNVAIHVIRRIFRDPPNCDKSLILFGSSRIWTSITSLAPNYFALNSRGSLAMLAATRRASTAECPAPAVAVDAGEG